MENYNVKVIAVKGNEEILLLSKLVAVDDKYDVEKVKASVEVYAFVMRKLLAERKEKYDAIRVKVKHYEPKAESVDEFIAGIDAALANEIHNNNMELNKTNSLLNSIIEMASEN